MPDEATATTATTTTPTVPAATTSQPTAPTRPEGVAEAEWNALGDPGKAALVRERTAKTEADKALAEALAKVKAFEDAQKTDAEKAADALKIAQNAASEAAAKALRYEVASTKGLPLDLAQRLVGATQAELEADADKLKAQVAPTSNTPRPDRTQGGTGTTPAAGPAADFANFLTQQLGH